MHLYLIARGHHDRLMRWMNDCLAQYLPFKYDEKKPPGKVQLAMRPIQLFEVVFPESEYDKVLSILQPYNWRKKDAPILAGLRRLFGAKPIKKGVPPDPNFYRDFVEVAGIGVKKDKWIGDVEQL